MFIQTDAMELEKNLSSKLNIILKKINYYDMLKIDKIK